MNKTKIAWEHLQLIHDIDLNNIKKYFDIYAETLKHNDHRLQTHVLNALEEAIIRKIKDNKEYTYKVAN
jgi:hypothetical protein